MKVIVKNKNKKSKDLVMAGKTTCCNGYDPN